VLQLRLSEEKDIAWPDEEFERIARALYQSQFDLSSTTTTTMLEHLCLNLAHSLTRSLLNSGHAAGIGIGRERPHRLLRLQGTPGRPRVLAIDEREHQSVLLPLLRLQHVVQADTALHGPSRWRLGHVASSVPYRNVPPRTNPHWLTRDARTTMTIERRHLESRSLTARIECGCSRSGSSRRTSASCTLATRSTT